VRDFSGIPLTPTVETVTDLKRTEAVVISGNWEVDTMFNRFITEATHDIFSAKSQPGHARWSKMMPTVLRGGKTVIFILQTIYCCFEQ